MKTKLQNNPVRRSSSQFLLTGILAASACLALASTGLAQGNTNPFGTNFHTVDGTFSGGVLPNGTVVGEWSDVTPSAFISLPNQAAIATTINDPAANTLLYAGLGQTAPGGEISLFLMYDFLPRTTPPQVGEVFASIAFPVTLPGQQTGEKTNIAVLFQGNNGPSFFDVFVDLDLNGTPDIPASALGNIGATSPGASRLSQTPHLRAELQVPLRIPAGFAAGGSPLPGNGINPATGLYDPDPAFWGASAAGDGGGATLSFQDGPGGLQSASSATFTINPNGSIFVAPVPEPGTAAWGLVCTLAFLRRRRDRSA